MAQGYDHSEVEAKWRAYWEKNRTFATSKDRSKPKYYVLDMFPYPSGDGLHVGHPKGYVATDVVARARRMMGYNVLRVMGWDSFGLPAERQAVRENRHPREITERNVARFKSQLQNLGLSYDWEYELATSDERYYRWTQWIFLKLYEKGLAYQASVPVNWCPALGTVLSNEEVKDGRYVETGDPVERRMMKQWMLKITAYADRLVDDLETLDWPEGILQMQREWIGRSHGAMVRYRVDGSSSSDGASFEVFTTRPDTLFGCTYVVLAPEHPLVEQITTPEQREAVKAYKAQVASQSERDRTAQAADAPKTGVWTGALAINPVDGRKVQIWIADYVLAGYGTGAVFACPAGDERDYAFAKTFGLPIIEVVKGGDIGKAAYTGDGPHVNSGFLDGLNVEDAKKAIIAWLEREGHGKGTVQYRLRDWLFSRQRYWGEPFPLLHTEDGEIVPVPEAELPVKLPHVDEYRPTEDGRPPLARAADWVQARTPDGRPAERETNTMPQWAGSCWYYLRFVSPWCDTAAWDKDEEKYWMPVDLYVGGAEHAVLHLLYARFWHKVLYDLGLVSTKEPFQRLFNQGMIHAMSYNDSPDGRGKFYYAQQVEERAGEHFAKDSQARVYPKVMKMSKSRYNVTNPDDICRDYGADALRLYELFMGPLEDGAMWEDSGVAGTRRFLDKVWRLVHDVPRDEQLEERGVERALHQAIKRVTEGAHSLRFNTAVSDMMIFVNEALRVGKVRTEWLDMFVRILAPFAPHVGEELWRALGHNDAAHQDTVTFAPWPAYDEGKLALDTITIAVQVNGKLRGQIQVAPDLDKDSVLALAKQEPSVARYLEGTTLRREVYVAGRLVNLVVG
jgi:leucyl-tRNA synthetase